MTDTERADTWPSQVFGEVAEVYDAARPGYADALVTEVLAHADLGVGAALEIGAGTGKATVPFAAHGIRLTCVEPDPRMAEVLRRNTAAFPQVDVEVADFEAWESRGRRFGLLYAATCWHWIDPQRRWDLVHAALEPGGTLALFWNPHGVIDADLHRELAELDRRHGIASSPHGQLAAVFDGDPVGGANEPFWPEPECRRDGRFTDLRSHRFRQRVRYGSDRYLGLLASVSAYRTLPAEQRDQVLTDTARLLDAHGGGIDMLQVSDLFLARRR
ncbi:class I SAM-dependent methyltransferase [Kitasatospora sp. LaBMicrA B282]|uniref:class I SAM-dependent methyltransferase n=1 Tax=Kitasatospora sp. LaBMicrA B282 TaxID=3420949 RepID=UPI003D1519B9